MSYRIQLGPEQSDLGNNRGPAVGMFRLQETLRACKPDWLTIGGDDIDADTIPWFWLFTHGDMAVRCHRAGKPFIVGPNFLFSDSRKPGYYAYERIVLNSPHCKLIFTESDFYADLIRDNLGPRCKATICVVPYPVTEPAADELPPAVTTNVLIYAKSGYWGDELDSLKAKLGGDFTVIEYGKYEREELIYAAFTSRCCVYLSNDDRGPIAAAEILLAGCPIIGIERGCPWLTAIPKVGMIVASLTADRIAAALHASTTDWIQRDFIRGRAQEFFNPARIAGIVIDALDKVRHGGNIPLEGCVHPA